MNTEIVNFDFGGVVIPFELGGRDVMINATEMAKAFPGKSVYEWKRLPSTQSYLQAMIDKGFSLVNILVTRKSGVSGTRGGGSTWMHRLLAIEFARWLSQEFSLWCNEKIDEIISRGYALRDNQIATLQGVITSLQPRVDYYNAVLTYSQVTYSMTDIVKLCGFKVSAPEVYKKLGQNGFTMKGSDKKWYLKKPWDSFGYTKTVMVSKVDPTTGVTSYYTKEVWTESGRYWLYSLGPSLGLL